MKWKLVLAVAASTWCLSAFAKPAPDFTLSAVNKPASVTLSQQRGKFVVLHFLLKTECPICLKHTRDYALAAASMPDVVQVFIKPDAEADAKSWSEKVAKEQPVEIVIYRDPEAALAAKYEIPDGYKFHGQSVHYPALVLIGPDGEEKFRYVGKSNTDRYPVAQLKAKIDELKRGEATKAAVPTATPAK